MTLRVMGFEPPLRRSHYNDEKTFMREVGWEYQHQYQSRLIMRRVDNRRQL